MCGEVIVGLFVVVVVGFFHIEFCTDWQFT